MSTATEFESWVSSTWASLRPQDKEGAEGLLLYDSKDLVTHAVCVGMTGSGKTGLCISLLEEAAIDASPPSSSIRRGTWGISS